MSQEQSSESLEKAEGFHQISISNPIIFQRHSFKRGSGGHNLAISLEKIKNSFEKFKIV